MQITVTELKNNLSAYLKRAGDEDVLVTQYGRPVAKITSPFGDKLDVLAGLVGSVPPGVTLEEAKAERAARI